MTSKFKSLFNIYLELESIPDFEEKLAVSIHLVDATFLRSLYLHDRVITFYKEEAVRVKQTYLQTVFSGDVPFRQFKQRPICMLGADGKAYLQNPE